MISSSVAAGGKRFSEENSQNNLNTQNNVKIPVVELPVEEKNRGKRMMGVLMGTLSKFKSEEVDKSEANLKRLLLEQRLAQKLSQAKEQLLGTGQVKIEAQSNFGNPIKTNFATEIFPKELEQIKRETEEAQAQFQRTTTLPALYFKRAE